MQPSLGRRILQNLEIVAGTCLILEIVIIKKRKKERKKEKEKTKSFIDMVPIKWIALLI